MCVGEPEKYAAAMADGGYRHIDSRGGKDFDNAMPKLNVFAVSLLRCVWKNVVTSY